MASRRTLIPWLIICYAFLYLPVVFLTSFSFNDSRSVTTWSGFSMRWYRALARDGPLLEAAALSLRIAIVSATLALLAGTAAGFILARAGRFTGRTIWETALFAPLILPDVITGLALLLLFVVMEQAIGWPAGRGAVTVTIAHASMAAAYAAIVVRARLIDTGTAAEDAAADLYAPPWKVFVCVTLPMLTPALLSGWLLAFTLSLDDVVAASFTSGPGATTLPMFVLSETKRGVTPEIYALASVILGWVASGCAVAAVWRFRKRRP